MAVIGVEKTSSGFYLKEKVCFSPHKRHTQKIEDACFHSLSKDKEVYSFILTVSED